MALFRTMSTAFCLLTAVSLAQSEECSDVLISSKVNWQYDSNLKISILNLINRSNFEEKKKSLSAGAKFIVDAIPIEAFTSYEEFDQKRKIEIEEYRYNLDRSESASYVSQFVPSEAFDAYSDCIRNKGLSQFGLHLIPIDVSDEYVGLDLLWNSPPPVRDATLEIEITGGKATRVLPAELKASSFVPINIKREKGAPLRVTISANGFQPERFVVPVVQVPETTKREYWEISGYRPRLSVLAHIQGAGDITGAQENWVGTKGEYRRLEGFQIAVAENIPGISFQYMCHLEGIGDTSWLKSGEFCGTRGQERRLEGFAIKVDGEAKQFYDIVYQCHIEGVGDTDQFFNGQFCGTRGQSKRIESMLVKLVRK